MTYYQNGFSLCLGDMSEHIDDISALKSKAIEIFGYSELIAVSPPNSIGVLHFDCQHNFFIQIEGKKRWNISQKAAVVNPYENILYPGTTQKFIDEMMAQGYEILLPRDCGRKIYELNPGDVLYVPPGFYHSPETLNETSLHYTLTIKPACFWKDFNKNMFAKLLSSKGNFFADYRFLNGDQKYELISECIDLLMKDSK